MADMIEGDVGVTISVTLNEDVSDASTVEMIFRAPTRTTKTVTAAVADGETQIVEYTTEAGIFDVPGLWSCQVRIVQSGKDRRSSVFTISVEEAL